MTDSVIDMSVVQELLDVCDDDPELLVDLIRIFLEDAPEKVRTIVTGLDTGDLEAVCQAAHSLKGSAGNLGATEVQRLSEELQLASRAADRGTVAELVPPLQQHYAVAEQALRDLLSRHGG